MKYAKKPYDIKFVKQHLNSKTLSQLDYLPFYYYKKIFMYLYPYLTKYYIRAIMTDLIKDEFIETTKIGNRKHYKLKNPLVNKNIYLVEWL